MKTMICLILDRSGSMSGRENDVVGGVNAFIEEQKKLPDPASIAFVRFETGSIERFRPMMALGEVKPLDRAEYVPAGGTPLLDAIGQTVTALEDDWKREQPERAIVVIVTDGEENASREYKKAKIKKMIESRQASGKWAFIYLGANVDAFAEGASMGFSGANTAQYTNSAVGTVRMYGAVSKAALSVRETGQTLAKNLGGHIGEKDDQYPQPPVVASPVPPVTAQAPAWTEPKPVAAWTPPA